MDNTIKASIDCGNGEVNEIKGEGIIAIALTQEDDGVRVESDIEGMISAYTLASAIKTMQVVFGKRWGKAMLAVAMDEMMDNLSEEDKEEDANDDDGIGAHD